MTSSTAYIVDFDRVIDRAKKLDAMDVDALMASVRLHHAPFAHALEPVAASSFARAARFAPDWMKPEARLATEALVRVLAVPVSTPKNAAAVQTALAAQRAKLREAEFSAQPFDAATIAALDNRGLGNGGPYKFYAVPEVADRDRSFDCRIKGIAQSGAAGLIRNTARLKQGKPPVIAFEPFRACARVTTFPSLLA